MKQINSESDRVFGRVNKCVYFRVGDTLLRRLGDLAYGRVCDRVRDRVRGALEHVHGRVHNHASARAEIRGAR